MAPIFLYKVLKSKQIFFGYQRDIKGAVMQIKKLLINDRLRVSKVSRKFRIPTVYNFAIVYP